MASFGYSIGDVVALGQIAWNVVRNARAACGEHDELTQEVSSLYVVLRRLEQEGKNTESLINKPDNAQELHGIVKGCEKVLKILDDILQKYNSLGEGEKKAKKLWKKIRFGNGEMQDLGQLRAKISYYTSAISLFLNMLTVGTLGKVEQQMNSAGDELREIRLAVNGITAHLLSNHREGSVLTNYEDDDKAVWKAFRRELVFDGFSSTVIQKHKRLIKAYVKELGDRGLLDDPAEADSGNVPLPPNHPEDFPKEVQGQNMLSDEDTGCEKKADIAENQENGTVANEQTPSSDIAPKKVPMSTTDDNQQEDLAREEQAQNIMSDRDIRRIKGTHCFVNQEYSKTKAESSPSTDIAKENIPSYSRYASVESDIDEDDIPGSQAFCEDPEITIERNFPDNFGMTGETAEDAAHHVVPLELEHHATSQTTFLFQPFAQAVKEATIRQQLTSHVAYDIRKINHGCSKTRYCTKCETSSSFSWWTNSNDIEPLNASTKIFDLSRFESWQQAEYPVIEFAPQIGRDWDWGRAYVTRLDFTPEQLQQETTHGNRIPLAETKKALLGNQRSQIEYLLKDLNSKENNFIFDWQLAQLRIRYDVCSNITNLIATVRRAPRDKGVSFESLYQEYTKHNPDGLLVQTQPASNTKSVPQPRALKDGTGFCGTYYKGLRLTTNLQAVNRAPGESDKPDWQLALILNDTSPKQNKSPKGDPLTKETQDNVARMPEGNSDPVLVPNTNADPGSTGTAPYSRKLSPELRNKAWPKISTEAVPRKSRSKHGT